MDFEFKPLDVSKIFYRTYGDFSDSSRPVLILIHGLLSSSETFIAVAPEFEKLGFNVLSYDQRGHGNTPRSGECYSSEVMAEDLSHLMDHLRVEKAHILGHSMGGRTLMGMLKLHPERVITAIIEDMGIHQRRSDSKEVIEDRLNRARGAFRDKRIFDTKEEIVSILSDAYTPEDANWFVANKVVATDDGKWELKFFPDVALLYGLQGNYTDMTPVMLNTTVPVLYLKADPDLNAVLTDECAKHILKHIPNVNIVEIHGADHSIHKSAPTNFVEQVSRFIQG